MARRYFVQLANVYKKQDVAGRLMSEKLDGMRCYSDGGVSRGLPCLEVPFANTAKDSIRRDTQIATGLWTRGGKKIPAPDWFLDLLPPYPLDGELYLGHGNFQQVMSICKAKGRDWSEVQYAVFAHPTLQYQFEYGDEVRYSEDERKDFTHVLDWWLDRCKVLGLHIDNMKGCKLKDLPTGSINDSVYYVEQTKLPMKSADYKKMIDEALHKVTEAGGEGLMLADPHAYWTPNRSNNLLKVKPHDDDFGEVVGYVWGKETDKGSKYANLMGQVRVMYKGHEFGLSGFTDLERELGVGESEYQPTKMSDWDPGQRCRGHIYSQQFPIGSKIRFKFRELTDDGVPKEARFMR